MTTTTTNLKRATGLRCIRMENETHWRRRSIGGTLSPVETLADVAVFLDLADGESIERHGHGGHGAGCHVEAVFDGDDPDDEDCGCEDVASPDDRMFDGLPLGSPHILRQHIANRRKSSCWDGHDYVPAPSRHAKDVLARIRAETEEQK